VLYTKRLHYITSFLLILATIVGCSHHDYRVSTDPFSISVTKARIFTIPANDDVQKYLPENYSEDQSRIYKGTRSGGINSSAIIYGVNDGGPDGQGYKFENTQTMVEVRFDVLNISRTWSKVAQENDLDFTDLLTRHFSFQSIINCLKFAILPHENFTYRFDYVLLGEYDSENDILRDCTAYLLFNDSNMFIQTQYVFIFQKTESDYFDGFSMAYLDFDSIGLEASNEVYKPYYFLEDLLKLHGYSAVVLNNYNLGLRAQDEIVIRTDMPYFEVLREVRAGIRDYPDNKTALEKINDVASILQQLDATEYIAEELREIAARKMLLYSSGYISEAELILALIKMEDAGKPVDFSDLRIACSNGKSSGLNEIAAMLLVIETGRDRLRYYNFSCSYLNDIISNASDEIKDALLGTPFIVMMRASTPSQAIIVDRITFRPTTPLPGGYLLTKSISGLPGDSRPPAAYYNDRYEDLSNSLFSVCDPDNISIYIDEEYAVSFIGNYELSGRNRRDVAVYGVTVIVTVTDALSGEVLLAKRLGESGIVPSTFFVPNTFTEDVFFYTTSVQDDTIDEILIMLNLT